MNKLQTQALHSYTEAKSNKYLQALHGLISMKEYDSWVLLNKPEIDNTLKLLETKPQDWLDSHAE